MTAGIVFDIKKFSMRDGPGIRSTVFLKGCPLRCPWCHNPERQAFGPELMVRPGRCIGCRACVAACPARAYDGNGGAQTLRCARHRHHGGCRDGCDARRACPIGDAGERCLEEEAVRHARAPGGPRPRYGPGAWGVGPTGVRQLTRPS